MKEVDVVLAMLLKMVVSGALKPEKGMQYLSANGDVKTIGDTMPKGIWIPDIGHDQTFQMLLLQATEARSW